MLRQEYKRINIHYFIIQLKGLLSTPFLNSDYMTEVLYIFPNEKYFAEKYLHEIFNWIDSILSLKIDYENQFRIATTCATLMILIHFRKDSCCSLAK